MATNNFVESCEIDNFLKHVPGYGDRVRSLPLGTRCRLPEKAAMVDLAGVLANFAPKVAKQ
eukprot:4325737-Karenia_brevis.AAC.1